MTASTGRPVADVESANIARIYDYYLGGLYNFEVDRQKAERIRSMLPDVDLLARANRDWLRRTVRFLLAQGVDQFVDLASGLPTMGNVHEVAHAGNPRARVVYVDHEPSAVLHGEEILADEPLVAMIEADGRFPERIWEHPRVRELIDLDRPVGILMGGLLVFVEDKDDPAALVASYRDACAPGSYLAVSHLSDDQADPETRTRVGRMTDAYLAGVGQQLYARPRDVIASWFEGMDLVEPGLTLMADWRPTPGQAVDAGTPTRALGYGATARVR